jgi:hypothetical protein
MNYDSEADTRKHIARVADLIGEVQKDLIDRARYHDASKLSPEEKSYFDEYTPKLKGVTYNSPEYKQFLVDMKPALDHHYAKCRHHPQHFKDGVEDMNIIDVLEMLLDWKASSERHNDGNIRKSIEINAERFGLSPQLRKIMENTCDYLRW